MTYTCHIRQQEQGRWVALHDGSDIGRVEVSAPSREAAIEKLRGELRYRLELCPCSGESYQHLEIEVRGDER